MIDDVNFLARLEDIAIRHILDDQLLTSSFHPQLNSLVDDSSIGPAQGGEASSVPSA